MEEQDESGFRSDRYLDDVCEHCIGDEALAIFVSRNGPIDQCGFCGRSAVLGMGVGDLFRYMAGCLAAEWDDPINEVGWDRGFDPGIRIVDSEDLLGLVGDPLAHEDLYWAFVLAFEHQWCQRSPYRLERSQMLLHSWSRFAEITKTQRRFLIQHEQGSGSSGSELLDPAEVLHAIGAAIVQADWRVVGRTADVTIARARSHPPSENHGTPDALGSAPSHTARHNRMSGAGISMFYGAESAATAAAEIRPTPDQAVTVAQWAPTRELTSLDLPAARPIPSIFDMTARIDRTWLRFLAAFADDLARPIEEHQAAVEYIPTQIMTEYIRDHLRTADGHRFGAIRYSSAADEPDGVCWVVFAGPSECGNDGDADRLLALDAGSVARHEPAV